MRRTAVFAILACVSLSHQAWGQAPTAAPPAKTEEDAAENYPDFPGREATYTFCTACHSFKIVAAQRMTRDKWDTTLNWMTKEQSMPPLDDEDRSKILNYLADAFPGSKGPGTWQNPFLK